ncbi:MAG TPA: FAD-binding oxidoreductase [Candidatus Eisenbacteria bacterium]|nr:FAD-binding oxidoreductase [Candidatus Eisenbacteria bacterium]
MLTSSGLSQLTRSFAGDVIRPGDPGYEAARVIWNGMIDRHPALIVRPTSTADVVTAVKFAREQELLVAVRSGGHSIPGLSTCDDGIVIDLSRMRGAEVDPARRIARVNGGALLGELDEAAQKIGLVCPVGVVSHTGVAGLTLGGGMGRLQRKYGLTVDSLHSVDLVTADGRQVRASADENAELFWGVRGAGANFGIATSFEFRLHPLEGKITHGVVIYPARRARELAARFREIVDSGPDDLFASFGFELASTAEPAEVAGKPIAFVSVHHVGSPESAERDIAALHALGPAVIDTIRVKPYLTAQRMNDETMRWGYRFYMKSAFINSLPDELIDRCVEHMPRVPSGVNGGYTVWACGRAIARVPEEATAFSGRQAAFWMGSEILWKDEARDDECRTWGRVAMAESKPYESEGRYVNDVAEVGDDVTRSVYGDAKYQRLVALKRAWDPGNFFRLNQNVRP